MIIECGERRLVSDRFGWMIQKRNVRTKGKNVGMVEYIEDRPAYPASLSDAMEMILEREMKDQGDMPVSDVPDALRKAYHSIHKYMEKVRSAV